MAPWNKGGVVDGRGRVYGVRNLIVADDSIIPFTVDGNTAAPAFLIGLTIAEQLQSDFPMRKILDKRTDSLRKYGWEADEE